MRFPVKLRAGIIGIAISFFLFIQILAKSPNFVENYYSRGIYPIITYVISSLSQIFPFSLSELALWFIILIGIPTIIYRIRKYRMSFSHILLNLLTTVAVIYIWFYFAWGINYFRVPLKTTLNLDRVNLSMNAFDSIFASIIDKCNSLNLTYSIIDVPTLNDMIEQSYSEVLPRLNLQKIGGSKSIKTFFGNWIFNKTLTSGWFSPFFHEVHYNSDLMIFELPFVLAHEKAHRLGYTSEAEANFLAFLVCTQSSHPLCQYSGYFQVLGHFFFNLKKNPVKRARYYARLTDGVRLDLEAVRKRWESHRGLLAKISAKGYNLYLQANRIPEGIENYSRVVDLIIRYYARLKSESPDQHQ